LVVKAGSMASVTLYNSARFLKKLLNRTPDVGDVIVGKLVTRIHFIIQ